MDREGFGHRHSHLVIILLAGVLGVLVTFLVLYGLRGQSVAVSPVQAQTAAATSVEQSFVEVAKRTLPAVVNISAERVTREQARGLPDAEEFFRQFPFPFPFEFRGEPFGREQGDQDSEAPREFERRAQSLGSGWVWSEDGYIVTNAHVVAGASDIKVTLHDRGEDGRQYDAKVVGEDPRTELAVLKVDAGRKLPTLKLGDSGAAEVGQWAVAVGAPFGLQQTVTVGVISAKGRFLPGQNEYIRIGDVIQTDAAINPGNSGGPLVNLRGEVIGINVAIVSTGMVPGNVGIGFAIPAKTAQTVIPALIQHGRVARGWLGIIIEDLTPNMRKFYGAPEGGALVTGIQPDAPAAKSDLKEDDVIVAVGDQPVRDSWELQKAVADQPPGSRVQLTVIRGKKEHKVTIELGEMPAKYAGTEKEKKEPPKPEVGLLGLRVSEITDTLKTSLKLPDVKGVVVLGVEADSPARGRLQKGDVITKINNSEVRSLDDYEAAVREARKAKAEFLIIRVSRTAQDGSTISSVVDIPTDW